MITYELDAEVIKNVVGRRRVGVYFLGQQLNDELCVQYVGRSDTDLKRRLLQHARAGQYPRFAVCPTKTIWDAYRLECREWHRFAHLFNRIHPDSPKILPYLCPYCIAGKEYREWIRREVPSHE